MLKDEIIKLRQEGKSYNEICKILRCSKGIVSYYCGQGQKEKHSNRSKKRRNPHAIESKIWHFKNKSIGQKGKVKSNSKKLLRHKTDDFQRREGSKLSKRNVNFTYLDIIERFGTETHCYLTGRTIDLMQPRMYHFDHIIPATKGGTNDLSNVGITCKEANAAKADLTVSELLELCKEILLHNGYKVEKE